MVLFRFFLFGVLIAIGVAGVLYLATRNPRYLKFAGAVLRFAVVFGAALAAFYVLERLILI